MGWSIQQTMGFRDRLFRLIGIPLVAMVIPPLFYKENAGNWIVYIHSLIMTFFIWEGSRQVFIRVTARFPKQEDARKRLFWIVVLSLLYTGLTCTVLGLILSTIFSNTPSEGSYGILRAYGGSYLMLLAIGALYESNYLFHMWRTALTEKEKAERAQLESQLEGLRNQVNPHFLFNSLNTLAYLIPEDPQKAVRFVQQMSKVYRYVLESRDARVISLSEELSWLESYVFLQRERFGENLRVEIRDVEGLSGAGVVPLTMQILFENAIKHNIISNEKPLTVELFSENGQLVVRNNLQRKNQVMDSTGVGLENIRSRYRMLTEKEVSVIASANYFTVILPLLTLQNA